MCCVACAHATGVPAGYVVVPGQQVAMPQFMPGVANPPPVRPGPRGNNPGHRVPSSGGQPQQPPPPASNEGQ